MHAFWNLILKKAQDKAVAAIILADLGLPIRSALKVVRQFRPGAIETKGQENFILNSSLD